MVKRVAILAALATACAASNQHLETRVDNLTTELDKLRRELGDLRQQLDLEIARSRPAQPGQADQLAARLDEMSRRLDQLAAIPFQQLTTTAANRSEPQISTEWCVCSVQETAVHRSESQVGWSTNGQQHWHRRHHRAVPRELRAAA
jgi:predicted nuclease with TOPRIM domain